MFDDLINKFEKIGARARVRVLTQRRRLFAGESLRRAPLTIDIFSRNGEEIFDISLRPDVKDTIDFQVQQILPEEKHLVLVARELDSDGNSIAKHHFLCGHDERHWFVAGVTGVSSVSDAIAALKPQEVRQEENRIRISRKKRRQRRNEVYVRQGEWFFIPSANLTVDPKLIYKHEPIRRGGTRRGKPHWAEFAYRTGGESVRVCHYYPNGLTISQYENLLKTKPEVLKYSWSDMKRNPTLYAKGRITHPDHATVILSDWHRVVMNAERRTETVAFLD